MIAFFWCTECLLEIKPRSVHMLGKYSTTELHSPSHSSLIGPDESYMHVAEHLLPYKGKLIISRKDLESQIMHILLREFILSS